VRIVLDTNVLVSGILTAHGPCGQIMELMIGGRLHLCFDGRILEEYERILLGRPRLAIPATQARAILDLLVTTGETVAPMPLPVALDDPDDLPFLEVASTAGVVLVTGNIRHYPARARAGVTVLSPRELLDLLRRPS
jgi:putative PIN family toxin of toxin-antitoxin system